jgi:hypothetical protein
MRLFEAVAGPSLWVAWPRLRGHGFARLTWPRLRGHATRDQAPRPIDWRAWLALIWMLGFGALYALMILREKAPGLLARFSAVG